MTELRHKVLGTVGAPVETKEKSITTNDLQSLIELGCIRDEVAIGNFKFVMRSLNASERLDLSKEFGSIDEQNNEGEVFRFNVKLLAIAVESVNGQRLEDLHPTPQDDLITTKKEIIASLQTPVLARLLEFYADIMERCDGQFGVEQVKN